MTAQERQQCLAYYEEELRLAHFQEKEADIHNNALVRYGTDLMGDRRAAQQFLHQANRLAASAKAILERRNKMPAIPDAAAETYFAWQVALSKYLDWASASASALEAAASGMTPNAGYVQWRRVEFEESRVKAQKCEQKLQRRLGLTGNDLKNLLSSASRYVEAHTWQPGQRLWETSEAGQDSTATPIAAAMPTASPGPSKQDATKVSATPSPTGRRGHLVEAALAIASAELSRHFYDKHLSKASVLGGVDGWAMTLETMFDHIAEADRSFRRVDRDAFKSEMTAVRLELFALAWWHRLKEDVHLAVEQGLFTRQYLEDEDMSDIWDIMAEYNKMIAHSAKTDADGQLKRGRKGAAEIASIDASRARQLYAWAEANIAERGRLNPGQMTEEEEERLDCAGRVLNRIGADMRRADCVAVKLVSSRLAYRLKCDPNLKYEALSRIATVVFGFYTGAEEYLKNPEQYQGLLDS